MQKRVNQFFKQIGLLATIGSSKGKLLHMRGVQKKKTLVNRQIITESCFAATSRSG